MDIFQVWNEIVRDREGHIAEEDDGRQEELFDEAINIALEHPNAVDINGTTYLVHDGSREVAYIIAAVTGGNEPSEKGYFYTATTQTCGPGFAMKFNEDEDDYPEIIYPDDVKAILGEAGQDA